MLTTNDKGNIGLYSICADLAKKQWIILLPQGSQPHYDLVIEKNGVLKRVQARFSSKTKGGIVNVKLTTQGTKTTYHTNNNVDIIAIYEPNDDLVYYINLKEFQNKSLISLRTIPPANNQLSGIVWAKDYLDLRL